MYYKNEVVLRKMASFVLTLGHYSVYELVLSVVSPRHLRFSLKQNETPILQWKREREKDKLNKLCLQLKSWSLKNSVLSRLVVGLVGLLIPLLGMRMIFHPQEYPTNVRSQ